MNQINGDSIQNLNNIKCAPSCDNYQEQVINISDLL
jgi:hypothetical protein